MYGDTEQLRALGARLRSRAGTIRVAADDLAGHAAGTSWTGQAARAMLERTRDGVADLRRTADAYDRAATELVGHADQVDMVKAAIARVERTVRGMVEAAKRRLSLLGEVAGAVAGAVADAGPDPLDVLLAGLDLPPPGSVEWLSLDLPGVDL